MAAMQRHLAFADMVNQGSYYTPPELVGEVYALLRKAVPNTEVYTVLDTSCGYGSFLSLPHATGFWLVGADVDAQAVEQARQKLPNVMFHTGNSLQDVSRSKYNLDAADPLIIVGNPPYNDSTSLVRHDIKREPLPMDNDIKARDLGVSFLLSYDKLEAEFVCVLHPLSYLIKRTNFQSLKSFREHYRLIDGVVINSQIFSGASKQNGFPIIIALYRRDTREMDYEFIYSYRFRTREGKTFSLNDYTFIDFYLDKYPNGKRVPANEAVAKFWTMRDINALRRARTFVESDTAHTVYVTREQLPYYCYVDVFKRYATHVPYYFGNCDVMIDPDAFAPLQEAFCRASVYGGARRSDAADEEAIGHYFKELLGTHYLN